MPYTILQDTAAPDAAPAAEAAPAEAPADSSSSPVSAGADGEVTFPDDYPNSVRHFLLLGAIAMFVGAVIFMVLNLLRPKKTIAHSVTFVMAAAGALAYYSMWTGLGVWYKTSDRTPRVIFFSRYIGHLFTMPLMMVDLALIYKFDAASMIALVGYDLTMVAAAFLGALSVGGHKWLWWCISGVFVILILILVLQRLQSDSPSEPAKVLTYIVIVNTCLLPLAWLLGSEGTASIGLTQEVALVTFGDIISVLAFGCYFLFNYDLLMGDEGEGGEKEGLQEGDSQQYV